MCVHDQACLYYRLLHCGIEETRKILQSRRSDPSLGVLIGRPTAPVSQWAPYFNTLEPLRQKGAVEAEPASGGKSQHVPVDLKASSDLPDSLSSHMEPGQPGEGGALRWGWPQGALWVCVNGSLASSGCPAILQPPREGARLRLASSPALSPEEFERTWLQLQRRPAAHSSGEDPGWLEELIRSPTPPHHSPHSLQAAMQLVNIQMLAFTPPHTLPWRVYLYTHAQPAPWRSTLILGELLWPGGSRPSVTSEEGEEDIRVTLRQQPRDDEALKGFFSILTAVLRTVSSQGQ